MHFIPTTIATAHSIYSGDLKVVEGLGFRHLSTDSIQHSGGIVTEIWSTALKSQAQTHQSWLVLGIAGGSVIKLISKKYSPHKITGIDIDPVIVDLGIKYFGLSQIKNLKLIITNAKNFCQKTDDYYDYIIVDLFGRDNCPDFVYSPKFLNSLRQKASQIFINHLYHTSQAQIKSRQLESVFRKLNIKYTSRYILKNIVYHFYGQKS